MPHAHPDRQRLGLCLEEIKALLDACDDIAVLPILLMVNFRARLRAKGSAVAPSPLTA